MLTVPSPPYRPRRKSEPVDTLVFPPVLVSAVYDPGTTITLAFDRAINIDNLDGNLITIEDPGHTGSRWEAIISPTLLDPNTVQIGLIDVTTATGSTLRLTALAGNGIVSASTGTEWQGVTDLELPFG